MRMMLMLVLALALAGCESVQTRTQKIAMGCASASAAIRVLTEANKAGKLSVQQQDVVSNAIKYVEPVCTAPTTPSMGESDMLLFNQSVLALQGEAVSHE